VVTDMPGKDTLVTKDFVNLIALAENGALAQKRQGSKNEGLMPDGRIYAHESLEGGLKTIGFGHKLKPGEADLFKNGITMKQALALLVEDIELHESEARKFIDDGGGVGTFDGLPMLERQLITELAFNIGGPNLTPTYDKAGKYLSGYPKLRKAAISKDFEGMLKELGRGYTKPDGSFNQLTSRVDGVRAYARNKNKLRQQATAANLAVGGVQP
tara:strand:- start:7162 stop:7803 length:642 start_codon:yes stop_codon:yes gene_type:complete